MAFSVIVEMLTIRLRRRTVGPVKLHRLRAEEGE